MSKTFEENREIKSLIINLQKAHNTISSETDSRQKHEVELAKDVDFMVIIVGHNSGNKLR